MQVIPVIDVRGGVAVAAVRGDRALYRPLETPLAPGADPVDVARGLLALFPFSILYVADLDGIERGTPDRATQARLADAWPGTELWIDDGGQAVDPLLPKQVRVIGSESQASLAVFHRTREATDTRAPLSLDFRGADFLGPTELFANAALWPDRIIVMTLARVGSGEGPDLARLRDIIARAGAREVFAAGGVRDAEDMKALRDIGAAGALIATALHQGRITPRDLETIAAA